MRFLLWADVAQEVRTVVWQSEGSPVRSHHGRVEVSLSETPNPQLLLTSCLAPCMAANRRCCVDGWMRGIHRTALWIKALYKCSPFTICSRWLLKSSFKQSRFREGPQRAKCQQTMRVFARQRSRGGEPGVMLLSCGSQQSAPRWEISCATWRKDDISGPRVYSRIITGQEAQRGRGNLFSLERRRGLPLRLGLQLRDGKRPRIRTLKVEHFQFGRAARVLHKFGTGAGVEAEERGVTGGSRGVHPRTSLTLGGFDRGLWLWHSASPRRPAAPQPLGRGRPRLNPP